MRIKLDENIPAGAGADLEALGHDVDTVPGEGLAGRVDSDIWGAAQDARRLLVTQDLDFWDIRRFPPGTHRGLMLVRLRTPGRAALRARIVSVFSSEAVADWESCLIVVSDTKVRVRMATPCVTPRTPSRRLPLPRHRSRRFAVLVAVQ